MASPWDPDRPVTTTNPGTGGVTVLDGQTFCASSGNGDVVADLAEGLFVLDSRVISRFELRCNGYPLEPLAVDMPEPHGATFLGRAHQRPGRVEPSVVVFRRRDVGQGMREVVTVTNYGLEAASVWLVLRCEADFADLFAVKEGRVKPHATAHDFDPRELRFRWDGPPTKVVRCRFAQPADVAPGRAGWHFTLAPGASWENCCEVTLSLDGVAIPTDFRGDGAGTEPLPRHRRGSWMGAIPSVVTDSPSLQRVIDRSTEDLAALRIADPLDPQRHVIAAGAPWFMTVFGRDSLLAAWMSLIADPSLALGVLEVLARLQGTDVDAATEEEPGKILHEVRFNAATGLELGGGDAYFGSVDATPLFVMLLGELRRWGLAPDVVERLLPHADRAIQWIETFGDRDGDGFVEYERRSPRGLVNQGWKDSWDAIRFADGTLARAPIALCEVQAYTYAAYVSRTHFAIEAGDQVTAKRCGSKALALRRRFNEDFWLDEHGAFALALDADKRPVDAIASNMGHCLWAGIVDPERAPLVARQLVDSTLFSGFGVRTLASTMRAFNPVSYHNGSVWPHDNALCIAGLMRYGFVDEAHRLIEAQLDAAAMTDGRLPELFAGFERRQLGVPASYPGSCSPQAWAAASPLLWLRALLRFDPWATKGQIWLDPQLPPSIRTLDVRGVPIGDQLVRIAIENGQVEISGTGAFDVVRCARSPLTTALG